MRTLRDAKVGDTVKVVKLHGEGATKRRIMDMGISQGRRSMCGKAFRGPCMELVRAMSFQCKADAGMIEIDEPVRALALPAGRFPARRLGSFQQLRGN